MANTNFLFTSSFLCYVLLFAIVVILPIPAGATYNVLTFGATPNGKTDSTKAFLRAWTAACSSSKPSLIYVSPGKFMIKRADFEGPCRNNRVIFQIAGTLLAPVNYWGLGNTGFWIQFIHVNGVSIYGGVLDGRGSRFWTCKRMGSSCPQGARSITFSNSRDIVVSGLSSVNSQTSHINLNGCTNVLIKGVNIQAPDLSPNTDGIHIQKSTSVTITGSTMKTGDDCISIGPGTKNLLVDGVHCGPGHGISIGSLARDYDEDGVEGVVVRNSVFDGSDNGLRIKSWARPSKGYVKGIVYQNIVMYNVKNPIIIDQRYCPSNEACPNQNSGIKISEVTYQNIRGTSATPVAVNFICSDSAPCSGIRMNDVKLTYMNVAATSFCVNAAGKATGVVTPGGCL